jgi:tetratricopeptide (TPR) repeat protein
MSDTFWSREGRGLLLAVAVGAGGVTAAMLSTRGSDRPSAAEATAIAASRTQIAADDRAGALTTLQGCAAREPRACACADAAEELAVDLSRYAEAWAAVEKVTCRAARHAGARAEALVATGHTPDGMREADAALALDAGEAHATYARAWALSLGGDAQAAAQAARRAVDLGRGVPAMLLLGMLSFDAGDVAGARTAFEKAAVLAPGDARVLYDQALVAQKQGRYRDAREGYLRALAVDPKMADARYNLVVLTHAAGADDEARHHLDLLAAIAPGDARLVALRASLSR